ncbi:glutathione S-transferase [Palleronia sediminis]|uniref:Glutathione S-transferase n=1 Tax=Palleronia sediminis TaxID=2547833 RepID=A0A4R6A494_9RHOB|nr:glutathione S-transferase [Palleronia sediminis]TDL78481.1 glutathione S-transferase [Palleronia sediminis]
MELFYSPASPFARKVRIVLHETGRTGDVALVHSVQTAFSPNPANQNPLGKIPCLTRADGPALYDSRVICRFLAETGDADLYPRPRLWEVLTLEATADGIMDAALLMVYEHRLRPEDKRLAEYVEAQWSKVSRALDALEARWMSHLAGPLDIGQIAVGAALGYLDFRHPERDWRGPRPALTAWAARLMDRESFRATAPEG